jgi:hypothetical protein
MDTQGYIIVFGSLAVCVVAFVTGYCIPDGVTAVLLRIFGILGGLAWCAVAFYLANAMNSDI